MFVTRLSGPWFSDEKANPTWVQIEKAIRAVGGKSVTLDTGDEYPQMCISGDCVDYIVFATLDGDTWLSVIDPAAPDGMFEVVAGDQPCEFSLRMRLDLATALKVAQTFADRGELEPSVTWSTDVI